MKVEHAYRRDASGNAVTHDLSREAFAGLRPVTHNGKSYPNGGWVAKGKENKTFTPPEVKEAPKKDLPQGKVSATTSVKDLPQGKVSATTSVKDLIAIIETEELDIDTQQPRGELIKQINEVRG